MLIALYTLPHLILFLKKFLFFTILFKIFIEIQLIYNVVLLSGVQQSDLVIHISISIYILFLLSLPL